MKFLRELLDLDEAHTHELVNAKTGKVVGKYSSVKRARTARDKKDNEYGGYAHQVREIKKNQ